MKAEEHSVWGGKLTVTDGERVLLEDASIGPLIIAKSAFSGPTTYWRSARTVQMIETGKVILTFVDNGSFAIATASKHFSASDSSLLILRSNTAYRTKMEPDPDKRLEVVSVLVPHHHATRHLDPHIDVSRPISTTSGAGLVARKLLDVLIEHGRDMSSKLLDQYIHLFLSAATEPLRVESENEGASSRSASRFRNIERFVEDHIADRSLSAASAARALNMSKRNLSKVLHAAQTSFPELVRDKRLEVAADLLKSNNTAEYSVAEISEMAGFRSHSAFFKCFRGVHGCSPGQYRAAPNFQ